MIYNNPIIKGFYPDPSICYGEDGYYYLVCSSFEFLPGIPVFRSSNLVEWEPLGHVLDKEGLIDLSQAKSSMGIFAPTIRYHQGTFYVVTTNITQGNFICHTKSPEQGWSEPIWIDCPMGIDPSLTFFEEDCYMQLNQFTDNGNQIIQFVIDPHTGERLTDVKVISKGTGARDTEGPHVYKKGDYFYLLLAEGGTREGHMVSIQRSKTIWGPYESFEGNPILTNRDSGKLPLQSVGHGDLIEDPDHNWWMVALATRPVKHRSLLGRETILLPVEWQDDLWPVVNQNGKATIEVETNRQIQLAADDTQKSEVNQSELLAIREIPNYKMSGATILLESSPNALSSDSKISFLGVRQKEYTVDFSVDLLDRSSLLSLQGGLAIYKDSQHFIQMMVTTIEGQLHVELNKTVDDLIINSSVSLENWQQIRLNIHGSSTEYELSVQNIRTNEKRIISRFLTKHLTSEVSNSPFTGVLLGIHARNKEGAECGEVAFENISMNYRS